MKTVKSVYVESDGNKNNYFALCEDNSVEKLRSSARLYKLCHEHVTRCGSAGDRERLGNYFTFGQSPSPYHMLKKTHEISSLQDLT